MKNTLSRVQPIRAQSERRPANQRQRGRGSGTARLAQLFLVLLLLLLLRRLSGSRTQQPNGRRGAGTGASRAEQLSRARPFLPSRNRQSADIERSAAAEPRPPEQGGGGVGEGGRWESGWTAGRREPPGLEDRQDRPGRDRDRASAAPPSTRTPRKPAMTVCNVTWMCVGSPWQRRPVRFVTVRFAEVQLV